MGLHSHLKKLRSLESLNEVKNDAGWILSTAVFSVDEKDSNFFIWILVCITKIFLYTKILELKILSSINIHP
jgi:hypothetical protein